jgi:hypothetical protein
MVLVALPEVVKEVDDGAKLHIEPAGSPTHESDIVPVKPFNGAKVTL